MNLYLILFCLYFLSKLSANQTIQSQANGWQGYITVKKVKGKRS
jgi:hypothetical protein